MTATSRTDELIQLAERVAEAEARAAVAEARLADSEKSWAKHVGYYQRKWAAAAQKLARYEAGWVDEPIKHGGEG